MKNILYAFAALLLLLAVWFIYVWFKAEPTNREPLPALLSALSSCILLLIACRSDNPTNTEGGRKGAFWRFNNAKIKGNNIVVKQGTKGAATLENNSLTAEGEGHNIEQG